MTTNTITDALAATTTRIRCGNTKVHKARNESFGFDWTQVHYHSSTGEVRTCFATEGGILSHAEQDVYDQEDAYGHEPTEEEEWVAAARAAEKRAQDHIDRYGW